MTIRPFQFFLQGLYNREVMLIIFILIKDSKEISKISDSSSNFHHHQNQHHLHSPNSILQFQLSKTTNMPHSNYHSHNFQSNMVVNHQQSTNYHSQHQQTPSIQTAILIPSNIISLNDLTNPFVENVGSNGSGMIHQNGYQHHHHLNSQQIYNNQEHDEINNFENEDEHNSNVTFAYLILDDHLRFLYFND